MTMTPFYLKRNIDVTGVSGLGRVAQGVILNDGRVAMSWLSSTPSGTVHNSLEAAQYVHGHGGATEFVVRSFAGDPYLSLSTDYPTLYELHHSENKSGMTRVGHVADVALFANSFTVVHWAVEPHQIEFFTSFDDFIAVHASSDRHPHSFLLKEGERR